MERRSGFVAAALVAVAAAAPAGRAQAPLAARAPRVVLIAEAAEDDSTVSLSALGHLLTDRLGMTTTLTTSHSAEIAGDRNALSDADLAVVFERFRTAPAAERHGLDALLARGGLLKGIAWALRRELPPGTDLALPEATPLPEFDVSTAYVSDWSQPIAKQAFPPEEGIGGFNDVNWIHVRSPDGALDLRRFDPDSKQGTIYVKSTFTVKGAREHELLLKVMNAGGAWAVRARVRDRTAYRAGKPK